MTDASDLAFFGNFRLLMPQAGLVYPERMDTGNVPSASKPKNSGNGQLFPEDSHRLTVEPLKPRRSSRTVKEIEALVVGLQVALVTELNATKEEILQAIRDGQASVEAIACEMVRKGNEGMHP